MNPEDRMATSETPVQVLDLSDEVLQTFGSEYAEKALVLQKELALEKIPDDATFQRIARVGLDAAANIRAIENYLNPLKERRYAAWKRVCDVLKDKVSPFESAKKKAGALCGQYEYEKQQERERAEAAERERLAKQEEDLRAQQAEQLAAEGRTEEGIALLEQPIIPSAPVVSSIEAPKVRGVSAATERWTAKVENLMELCKAVVAGKVPIVAIQANQTFLDQQARALKTLLSYPGVSVQRELKSSFRAR